MYDLRRLRSLCAIADHGSLTAAADALMFTQPAVSQHLAALEAEAFLVWPTFEAKRYARRLGRRLGLHKIRRRYRASVASRRAERTLNSQRSPD